MAGAPVQHPHQAYVDHVIAYSTNNNPSTIGDVMGFTPNANPNQGDKVTGTLNTYSSDTVSYKATYLYPAHDSSQQLQPYITAFTINGQTIDINFTDIYASHHDPFWFYSLNGNVLIQMALVLKATIRILRLRQVMASNYLQTTYWQDMM